MNTLEAGFFGGGKHELEPVCPVQSQIVKVFGSEPPHWKVLAAEEKLALFRENCQNGQELMKRAQMYGEMHYDPIIRAIVFKDAFEEMAITDSQVLRGFRTPYLGSSW
jgi:hypothetical protein